MAATQGNREMSATFHYIIVGAGSAGCVLAERLSRNPGNRVLLVEAGSEPTSRYIDIPMGIGKTLADPALTSYYVTEPDPGNAHRPAVWLRGRTLGGSSAINGMIYCRGHPEDYNEWEANDCPGWGWKHMAPVFKQIENHEMGPGGRRGQGGPLHVSIQTHRSRLTEAILDASTDLGIPRLEDVNETDQEGIGYTPVTIRNGRRWSAYDAFLRPARRRANLTVLTDMMVDRIVIEDGVATGIVGRHRGEPVTYRTNGDIILSAGALNSPKLLQLSGIGPAALLAEHGIPVLVDNPKVGAHMREHKTVSMQVELSGPYSNNRNTRGLRLFGQALRYLIDRKGFLASTYDLNGFIKTRPDLDRPDAQITFWSLSLRKGIDAIEFEKQPGLMVMGYPNRSISEGRVQIRSSNPDDPPLIHTNFLAEEYDRLIIIGIFRFMRAVFAHPALKPLIRKETWPGAAVETDDEILDAARNDGTCQHAAGTCRMGNGPDTVVDARLRVKGVAGLRVMDGSVLPTQITGNPNGPIMAMAWRASEIILEDRALPA